MLRARAWMPLAAMAAVAAVYAWLAFHALSPDAVYSSDMGIKFVQARELFNHHFRSLVVVDRASAIDREFYFTMFRPPFVFPTPRGPQVIFPPAGAVLQALFIPLGGIYGLRLLSLLAALVVIVIAWRFAREDAASPLLPIVIGLGTPLWFYAVTESEHTPAVALAAVAFALASRGGRPREAVLAGLAAGAGAAVRDEVALLLPGLLFAVWLHERRRRPLAFVGAGFGAALVLTGVLEVWWFGRPFAAHLQHAVHLLRSALDLTNQQNAELPELAPLTLRQRYEYVVQYWLLGYGTDRLIVLFAAIVAAGIAARAYLKSAWPLVACTLALAILAVVDTSRLLAAPKWVAGFYRLSPFVVFALYVRPARCGADWLWRVTLVTTVAYVALAFAGVDTSGGKSLGPRLLLPLLPLVVASAWRNVADYVRSGVAAERALGWLGLALTAIALAIHLGSTIPAYVQRSSDDAEAMRMIEAMPERVIVADDLYTGLQLLPLYYRRLILVADTPRFGREMGELLTKNDITSVLLVSRRPAPYIELTPLQRVSTMQKNRFRLENWKQ